MYREACHNCYDPDVVPGTFSEALDETRVVELDIHSHKRDLSEAPTGVWYVRHNPIGTSPNNVNNCISQFNGQSNQDFNICLENVQQWSIAHPGHDLIIVFIDLKPNYSNSAFWRPNHGTTDLDDVLKQFALDMGGLDMVYKPGDLQGSFSNARVAAQNENWPSLGNLKGKFMFVLTGGNIDLNEYIINVGQGAMAFCAVSPDAFSNSSNGYIPHGISFSASQEIVFYNLEDNQTAALATFIPENGYMSRSWQEDNPSLFSYYGGSITANVNNIAIKNIGANFSQFPMNAQLIDINNILVGGTPTSPMYIKSYYNNILQSALIKVTTQDLIVTSGTTYNIRAGQEVELLPGTDIQMGANTDISVGTCADYASNLRINPNIGNDGHVLSEKEMEAFLKNSTKEKNTNQQLATNNPPLVYPNPAKEIVYIDFSNATTNQAIFTLYDITGRMVKTKVYTPQNEGNQHFSLNINELKAGTYFYTLQVGEQSDKGKVVKMGF